MSLTSGKWSGLQLTPGPPLATGSISTVLPLEIQSKGKFFIFLRYWVSEFGLK